MASYRSLSSLLYIPDTLYYVQYQVRSRIRSPMPRWYLKRPPMSPLKFRRPIEFLHIQKAQKIKLSIGSEDLHKVFYIPQNPSINGWPLMGIWTLLPEDLYNNYIFGENPFYKWLTFYRSLKTSTDLHDYEDRVGVLFIKQTFYMCPEDLQIAFHAHNIFKKTHRISSYAEDPQKVYKSRRPI